MRSATKISCEHFTVFFVRRCTNRKKRNSLCLTHIVGDISALPLDVDDFTYLFGAILAPNQPNHNVQRLFSVMIVQTIILKSIILIAEKKIALAHSEFLNCFHLSTSSLFSTSQTSSSTSLCKFYKEVRNE